jgi:hypothetical protein
VRKIVPEKKKNLLKLLTVKPVNVFNRKEFQRFNRSKAYFKRAVLESSFSEFGTKLTGM